MALTDSLSQSIGTSSPDTFLSALVVLAATASIVVASVSRQENLSSRTRALTREFRELLDKADVTIVDRERLLNLPDQIFKFHDRLRFCVIGHICLYFALAIETFGFGVGFLQKLLRDGALNQAAPVNVAVSISLLLVGLGIASHIVEYASSNKTIDLEVEDIRRYAKDVHGDIDGFLKKVRGS